MRCYHDEARPEPTPDTDGCTIYACPTCGERWNTGEMENAR